MFIGASKLADKNWSKSSNEICLKQICCTLKMIVRAKQTVSDINRHKHE